MSAAQRLILAKGFEGTSVDEVCRCARLTKGSFFHYFDSKDALGLELLTRYCEAAGRGFAGCCSPAAEKDPLKRVYKLLDFIVEKSKIMGSCGCLLGSMSQELADSNEKVRALADRSFSAMSRAIAQDLALAKKKYASRASFDPRELADQLVSLMQGGALLAKVRKDGSIAAANLRHFRNYLKVLYGR